MATVSTNWKEYQEETAAFFREQGCHTEIEAEVKGVRSKHKIDVWVTFSRYGLECKWVIECKFWDSNIPKEKVLVLKSIVEDVGADRGIIFSEKGFQAGAHDAARGTNITLISSLDEFRRTAKTDLNAYKLVQANNSPNPLADLYCFPKDNKPNSLLYENGILFVGNWHSSNIAFVNPSDKTVVDIIELDNYEAISSREGKGKKEIRRYSPGNMSVADGKLFVGQVFSEFILVIDIETRAIVKRIFVPGGGEGELASSSDGRKIYFASNTISEFFIIDSATYEYKRVPYPRGGRGISSILANDQTIYLGIQRGGQLHGKTYSGGNSFLAVYDLQHGSYRSEVYLAEIVGGESDNGIPICLTFDSETNLLYVGMFQSRKGIYYIDTNSDQIVSNIDFEPNSQDTHFDWVDPLAQVIYEEYLLSINRNNYELVIIDRQSKDTVKSIPLGKAPNGPNDVVLVDRNAVVSYPEFNGLIFVDLLKALQDTTNQSKV